MKPLSTSQRFFSGVRLYWRGLRLWGTNPGLMVLGLVPGLISVAIFTIAVIALLKFLGPLSQWILDLFTDSTAQWTTVAEVLIALGLLAGAVVLVVYTFAAVTLLIGTPFFERISTQVDRQHGHQPVELKESWWNLLWHGAGESLGRLALTIPLGIALFLMSLIPVIGTATSVTLGALFGGWFLSLELTSFPLTQRGYVAVRPRRELLRRHRATAVGFGAMAFIVFLIPGGAVLGMPAAVSGGTLLAQRVTQP